jgi:hypothetical protein
MIFPCRPLAFVRPIATAILLVTALCSSAAARTWTVRLDGSGDFTVIQDALDAAMEGDTVLVGPGHYTWTNQATPDTVDIYGMLRFWKSEPDGITLKSERGPEQTILDAERRGRVLFANGDNVPGDPVDFVVDGFTMTRGLAIRPPNRIEAEGGAMAVHLTYATFRNCVFRQNEAEYGGAVWAGGVSGNTFENCRFENNVATLGSLPNAGLGGGLFVVNSSVLQTFRGCTFVGNEAQYRGGGVFVGNARVEFIDCVLASNWSSNEAVGLGAAMYCFIVPSVVLDGVLIRDNDTTNGPAVSVRGYRDPNTGQISRSTVEIKNSVIARNPSSVLTENAIVIDSYSTVTASCTDIWGHRTGNWERLPGQLGVRGNVELDPQFCGAGSSLRLVEASSPLLAEHNGCAIDMGNVVGNCATVPVLMSEFGVRWEGSAAGLRWRLEVDSDSAGWLELYREATMGRRTLVASFPAVEAADGEIVDPEAPADGAIYWLQLRSTGGEVVVLGSAELTARTTLLRGPLLHEPRPNPFNPRTSLRFELPASGPARLAIHDVRGRQVRILSEGWRAQGDHFVTWDGTDQDGVELPSGVYYAVLASEGRSAARKMVLVR